MVATGIASVVVLALLVHPQARAGAGEDCDDLSELPETPYIDYQQQIQSIWEIRCANCHVAHEGMPAGNLSLNADYSWFGLVEMPSFQRPDMMLVAPGEVAASYLFQKINCELPSTGLRMPRGRLPLPLQEQALIRDWIRQGALEADDPRLFVNGFETTAEQGDLGELPRN